MDDTAFGWPPQESTRSRTARVETGIDIARSPGRVFDYVTTPALWPTWHPATVAVRDAPNRPLVTGETMVEEISLIGRRFAARWTVLACEAPELWVTATATPGGDARIIYRIAPAAPGCRFHRTLDYRSRRSPWRALDANVTRWLLRRQSARALANLKRLVEQLA